MQSVVFFSGLSLASRERLIKRLDILVHTRQTHNLSPFFRTYHESHHFECR